MEKLKQKKCESFYRDKADQVLHMNGGEGITSYAKNSTMQGKLISMITKPMLEKAVVSFYEYQAMSAIFPDKIGIADLGCSSGPNALLVVSEIVNIIDNTCHKLNCLSEQCQLFLNDLPGNDFNTVFRSVESFQQKRKDEKKSLIQCFISGVPGSFYGRLFPSKSLHFVNSSYCLHWLSQVPPELKKDAAIPLNKGNIYISETSPPSVAKAYQTQFQRDFLLFLRSRSEEIVPGGYMVLTLRGRRVGDPVESWDLLANALNELVEEGLIEKEQLDNFNLPCYEPSAEEMNYVIQKQGYFELQHFEIVVTDWDEPGSAGETCNEDTAQSTRNLCRAVTEPYLRSHFSDEVMDPVYAKLRKSLDSRKKAIPFITLALSLVRKGLD